MRRWFEHLSIHRKLVAMALAIATVAMTVAVGGLVVIDLLRFRADAEAETEALTSVLIENASAAVIFDDPQVGYDTLASLSSHRTMRLACLYLADGTLFSGFAREGLSCPDRYTTPVDGWRTLNVVEPVRSRGEVIARLVLQRDMSGSMPRVFTTVGLGLMMLVLATAVALLLANRLQRTVSRPIAALARAARDVGRNGEYALPAIAAPPDEVGELVTSFTAMVTRVREANTTLTEANEALRREVEERMRVQAEREDLLVRERRASQLKDEFLATVSHELRTPLNAILGWSHVLTNASPTPATLTRALDSIARNAKAQARLIEDLIDISRIVAGKVHLKMSDVDLRTLIDASADIMRPIAAAKQVTLTLDLADGPCVIQGDDERVQQVLWNVLTNAIKFTPEGGEVTLTLLRGAGSFIVSVRDTGVGINPDLLPFIFERFRQADGSMTREYGGLGLGLAISKELTELHGGTIAAASDGHGRGAEFTITLPARTRSQSAPDAGEAREAEPPLPSLAGLRVMAVDDSVDSLDVLSATLTAAHADVVLAASGEEAVERWAESRCDVLLCDLAMPHMNGYQVLQRIRALDADAGRATVAIAVSAHASEEARLQSRDAGFVQHVSKPFKPGALIRAVALVMNR